MKKWVGHFLLREVSYKVVLLGMYHPGYHSLGRSYSSKANLKDSYVRIHISGGISSISSSCTGTKSAQIGGYSFLHMGGKQTQTLKI